jgi:opacity protein-like surface antigen
MRWLFVAAVLGLTCTGHVRGGSDSPPPIDLSGFESFEPSCADGASATADMPAGDILRPAGSGFYLTAIVGGSFATLSNPDLPGSSTVLNQPLFTGGGAVGWSFERPHGFWRAEFEARSRENMGFTESDPVAGTVSFRGSDGWSTMANLWREYRPFDRGGIYVGGGVGAGGFVSDFSGTTLGTVVSGSTGISSFAWQAGGGATYALSDRVTLDLGYRFFSLAPESADILLSNATGAVRDSVRLQFVASELLLSLRIYEPFRRWH